MFSALQIGFNQFFKNSSRPSLQCQECAKRKERVQDSKGTATEANFAQFSKCYYALMQGWRTPPGVCLISIVFIWVHTSSPVSSHRQTVPAIKSKYLTIQTAGPNMTTAKNVGLFQFIISTVLYSCESCVDELLHGGFEQGTLALQIHLSKNYGQ
jgi:hypothetical protein